MILFGKLESVDKATGHSHRPVAVTLCIAMRHCTQSASRRGDSDQLRARFSPMYARPSPQQLQRCRAHGGHDRTDFFEEFHELSPEVVIAGMCGQPQVQYSRLNLSITSITAKSDQPLGPIILVLAANPKAFFERAANDIASSRLDQKAGDGLDKAGYQSVPSVHSTNAKPFLPAVFARYRAMSARCISCSPSSGPYAPEPV